MLAARRTRQGRGKQLDVPPKDRTVERPSPDIESRDPGKVGKQVEATRRPRKSHQVRRVVEQEQGPAKFRMIGEFQVQGNGPGQRERICGSFGRIALQRECPRIDRAAFGEQSRGQAVLLEAAQRVFVIAQFGVAEDIQRKAIHPGSLLPHADTLEMAALRRISVKTLMILYYILRSPAARPLPAAASLARGAVRILDRVNKTTKARRAFRDGPGRST